MGLDECAGSTTGRSQTGIQHIVIIVQENRTPDNLFQDPVLISRGADIAQSGLNSSGQTIPLSQGDLAISWDLVHAHGSFEALYDGGKMDGENLVPTSCSRVPNCQLPTAANPQYAYIDPSEVQPYFQLAEQYTFGDRMFQTNEGPSFPAHQFLFGGASAPTATSNLFAAENVSPGTGAGCIAPPGNIVKLIDPQGVESSSQYPASNIRR